MKLLILLLTLVLISCSKVITEKPVIERSVTYLRHHYDTNDRLVKVDTSIHWCRVSGEELRRFESYPHYAGLVCDTDPVIRLFLVIGEPCQLK